MADVFPAEIDLNSIESDAEGLIISKCRTELPPDWLVIHSLWIRTSSRKRISEIDFIVITGGAVLCLEVKGGNLSRREDGVWEFHNKNGKLVNSSNRGPFYQARNAYFDLETHLKDCGFGQFFREYAWWYGVVTPECVMKIPASDPEISPAQYCDEVRFDEDFSGFLSELSDYARERINLIRGGRGVSRHIASEQRQKIRTVLKSSIGYIEGLGLQVHRVQKQINSLTEKQFSGLKQANQNPRIVLLGGAGTGKTVLAYQMARLKAISGEKVLFTCFNRKLADHLAFKAQGDGQMESVLFANYHQLLVRLMNMAGMSEAIPEDWDTFNRVAEDRMIEAVSKLNHFETFDYLVVDEGQDLMRSDFLQVISNFLSGGLSGGEWTICLDPEQSIFVDQYDRGAETGLLNSCTKWTLDENIRNTREIAAWTYGLSGVEKKPLAQTSGSSPEVWYYKDERDLEKQIKKRMNVLLGRLINTGGVPASICVLAPRKEPYLSLVKQVSLTTIREGQEFRVDKSETEKFSWTTVQAFKGLEADIVLLVGISDLTNKNERRLMYVGGSRAKTVLEIFLPVSQQDAVGVSQMRVLEFLS